MLTQLITVLCHSNVGGPNGKLFANNLYELQDSEYVRTLIKSGTVSLVDPPSLDPGFLEQAGYPLCEGYSYSKGAVVVTEPDDTEPKEEVIGSVENSDKTPTEAAIEATNIAVASKKDSKNELEEVETILEEKDDSHEGGV